MATGFIRKFSALALAAAVAATAFADYTTGTVSGLTARQRRPWNGLVDISFTLTGPEEKYCVAITATNSATGEAIPARTLRDRAGNVVRKYTKFAPGAVSLVWDAMSDAPGLLVEALALSVVTAPPPGGVQLWDGGPYWATANVGAEEPWEYGLYFWWGDTVGYRREGNAWVASDGSNANFSFGSGSTPTYGKSPSTLQSEGWTTSAGVLAPEHDAAHVHKGGSWRMPTKDELAALNNNCDWTWTTMNGVNGNVVRGRDSFSEASIFLPAAGCGYGTSLGDAGSLGSYWSSVLNSGNYGSWYLYFDSGYLVTYNCYRYYGFPVRPVLGFTE